MSKKYPAAETRDSVNTILKNSNKEENFTPNAFQSRVKARFYRRLEEMADQYDRATVFESKELVEKMAGTPRVIKWLEDPVFASWFVDEEFVVDTIMSLQSDAVGVVRDVLSDIEASASDKLKAARMLLELGDQFPGRKSEVKFLDERLNQLSESDTDREIAKLEGKLNE